MLKKRIDSKQRELSAASQRFKCAWQVWETGQWRPSGAVSQSVEYEVEVRRSAEDRQGQAPRAAGRTSAIFPRAVGCHRGIISMAAIHSVSTFLKIMLAFFVENDFLKFLLNSFRPNHLQRF